MTIEPGKIFVDNTYGYFYEVVAATTRTVTVRPIATTRSLATMPVPGEYTGGPKRRTVRDWVGRPCIKTDFGLAALWDGTPYYVDPFVD